MVPNVTRLVVALQHRWSVSSPLRVCITYRASKKLSMMIIGQLASPLLPFPLPSLWSIPLNWTEQNSLWKAAAGEKIDNKTRKKRHRGVWEWCRQLSVLLESDQTGLARLLHYILAQSKIVWPGTALPLGARSFTTHRLYCTQEQPARLQISLYSTRDNSPSLCVFVRKRVRRRREREREGESLYVVWCLCECLKWEVIQLLVFHFSFPPGCNRPMIV